MLSTRMRMAAAGVSAGGGNWWEAGGAAGAVGVYQPIGAASLAASYTDLSGTGNDAAPGVAPTWNATDGWVFNGSTQYLTTGVVPVNDQTWSALIRFSDLVVATDYLLGANEVGGDPRFYLGILSSNQRYGNGGLASPAVAMPTSGVMSFAGPSGYMDGSFIASIPAGGGTATQDIYIAARNNGGSPGLERAEVNIQAVAIYNNTLDAAEVSAVSAAMAALT